MEKNCHEWKLRTVDPQERSTWRSGVRSAQCWMMPLHLQVNQKMMMMCDLLEKSFRNTIRVSNGLDPDQDRQNVGPDLGPNCLQRLSADNKSRR